MLNNKKTKCIILIFMFLLAFASPAFADATVEEINNQVSKTALFIALSFIVIISILFIIKHQYVFLAAFLVVSTVVLLIIATSGMILLVPVKWVAGWFGIDIIISN
ncbi:hypothetical protein V6C27_13765 [Peptococcaceae bacterium 1198_IL3148]